MGSRVEESVRDKLGAFSEVMRCELGNGYGKYELDEYEMMLLMDGISGILKENERLKLRLEWIAQAATSGQ